MTGKERNDIVTDEHLAKYFAITGEALEKAGAAINKEKEAEAKECLDMAQRYYDDAKHFKEEGHYLNAYGALNYAHGWLDAGARFQLFKVSDSRLFTADEE